jgi:hypothetical protein
MERKSSLERAMRSILTGRYYVILAERLRGPPLPYRG